jgi:uncharacterized protein YbjQ (UPF0145 family)
MTENDMAEWSAEQIATASIAEVAAGRLPLRAQWRIAEQRARRDRGEPGSFTSNLSVQEFAAIRSVGFSPVGQVMGSAVFNLGWSSGGCGVPMGFYGGGYGGGLGGYQGWAPAPVVPATATQRLLNQARHRAVARMREECAGLGGDGVVGVDLKVSSFYGSQALAGPIPQASSGGLEFLAIGTAVRADGVNRPREPFTSDLSGQDFAKLLRAGWVPVALAQGVGAVIRHNDWRQQAQQTSWYNQEIAGLTALVQAARASAGKALGADARAAGGQTVILRDMTLRVFETRCASGREGEDHIADAFLWGTAIVPIDPHGRRPHAPEAPLTMLRLDHQKPMKGTR